jgi:lysophospholipase L1-like esterase
MIMGRYSGMKTSNQHHIDSYVGLGDSMSIDDYAGGTGAVRLLAQHLSVPLCNLARDGATSERVLFSQLPVLSAQKQPPALITLTIGGNDLLQAYGDDAQAFVAL